MYTKDRLNVTNISLLEELIIRLQTKITSKVNNY